MTSTNPDPQIGGYRLRTSGQEFTIVPASPHIRNDQSFIELPYAPQRPLEELHESRVFKRLKEIYKTDMVEKGHDSNPTRNYEWRKEQCQDSRNWKWVTWS
jgi:hypothetical protein